MKEKIDIKTIIQKSASVWGVKVSDILDNNNRHKDVILSKCIVVEILSKTHSNKFIQSLLGYKSHASVIHAKKTFNNLMLYSAEFREKALRTIDNKVYICGKISGLKYDIAYSKFLSNEIYLKEQGYYVVNPMKIIPKSMNWSDAMSVCLNLLKTCEHIYIMENASDSDGAKVEIEMANKLNINKLYES